MQGEPISEMPSGDLTIRANTSGIVPFAIVGATCAAIGLALCVVTVAFLHRPPLTGIVFVLLGSTLVLIESVRWLHRERPLIVLGEKGLWIRKLAKEAIPWSAVSRITSFSVGSRRRLAVSFDSERVKPLDVSYHGMKGALREHAEFVLEAERYDADLFDVEHQLRARSSEVHQPTPAAATTKGRIIWVAGADKIVGWFLGLCLLAQIGSLLMAIPDHKLRNRIEAPYYDRKNVARLASAPQDIRRYPRDSRVRLVYGKRLMRDGRLPGAEAEFAGALADTDALRAVSAGDGSSRYPSHLPEEIKIALALALAREGKSDAAKAEIAGLCPYVPNADMPTFIGLHLCHYE